MNRRTVVLLFLVALVAPVFAEETILKAALLLVPPSDTRSRIVEFRWDEDEPLRLPIWSWKKDFCTRGNMRVYSDDDKLVPVTAIAISDPPVGETRVVRRGELVRLYLDSSEMHALSRSGDYYEVASFDGWSGKRRVLFETKQRWFKYRKE